MPEEVRLNGDAGGGRSMGFVPMWDTSSSGSLWRIIGGTCYTILKVVWGIKRGLMKR